MATLRQTQHTIKNALTAMNGVRVARIKGGMYMNILSEREYYDFHPGLGFVCLVLGLVALGLVVALIFHAFKDGEFENLFAVAFLILIALILFKGFDKSLDHKMVYEYKATITDFNEVHDKGYEIVDREGEIYTLVKEEDK